MEKLVMLRTLHRSICRRSFAFAAPATAVNHQSVRRYFPASPASIFSSPNRLPSSRLSPSAMGIGITRSFSQELTHLPDIKDPQIENAIKDLMAASWDELPDSLIYSVKKALSLKTEDKAGLEALANVFHAAEAVEEFGGTLITLKMELDDSVGMGGEDVKPLSNEIVNALRVAYERYTTYLDAFGPDEAYLRKKVENELGIKMIYLKMRCGGLGSEWGKVTVLGTSGLSGSYVEQRA